MPRARAACSNASPADATSARVQYQADALEGGIDRLLNLVAEGHLTASDTRFAKKHGELAEQLTYVKTETFMIERPLADSERRITPELIERFAKLMRERLRGEDPALR